MAEAYVMPCLNYLALFSNSVEFITLCNPVTIELFFLEYSVFDFQALII